MIAAFQRAGQLGLLAAGLADVRCRGAGPSRDRAVRGIVDRLGLMHGLPQKIGQLLAFSELDESDPAFMRLTENEPSLTTKKAFAEIERQLAALGDMPPAAANSPHESERLLSPSLSSIPNGGEGGRRPGEEALWVHGFKARNSTSANSPSEGEERVAAGRERSGRGEFHGLNARILPSELPPSLSDRFNSIEPRGISASIGQVHRATLRDGREVAVKIQYPDIAQHVAWDLRALGWMTAPVGDLRKGFDMGAYRHEIGTMLEAELDYTREAGWLKKFSDWTCGWTGIELPKVIDELSGPRLLTTTWLDGERLAEARHWPEVERAELATQVLKFFLSGVFEWGCIHADPHPGNYRFIRNNGTVKLGVLDFGCVKEIEPGFAKGLRGMIDDAISTTASPEGVWGRFVEMGFNTKSLDPLRSMLPEVARVLCEPFVDAGVSSVAAWNPGERIARVLGAHRMAFRLAGPSGMIYFLRSFQGVLQYLRALDAPVDWREALRECGCGEPPVSAQRFGEHREKLLSFPLQPLCPPKLCAEARTHPTANEHRGLNASALRMEVAHEPLRHHSYPGPQASFLPLDEGAGVKSGSKQLLKEHPTPKHPMLSDTLHIQVTEAGQLRVALAFGAGAVDHLPDLVPHDLKPKLAARAIDLASLADRARQNDYAAGEVFTLEDGGKTVRVWLS